MSELQSIVDFHYAAIQRALDDLRRGVRSTHGVEARVFEVPPPSSDPDDKSPLLSLGLLDYTVVDSARPVEDALDAWAVTQRRSGQHPRYVARWLGVVVLPRALEGAVNQVNAAKVSMQTAINQVLPGGHYDAARRMARSRQVATALPWHTDRRLLYRHIPVYAKELLINRVYLHWRIVPALRRVNLDELWQRLEHRPIPPDVSVDFIDDETKRIYNGIAQSVRDGYKLVERTLKTPSVAATLYGAPNGIVQTLPISLPMVVYRDSLGVPVSDVLEHVRLNPLSADEQKHRVRKTRSDQRRYVATEVPGLYLQGPGATVE